MHTKEAGVMLAAVLLSATGAAAQVPVPDAELVACQARVAAWVAEHTVELWAAAGFALIGLFAVMYGCMRAIGGLVDRMAERLRARSAAPQQE